MRKSTTNMNLSLKLQSPDDYQMFVAGSSYVEKWPDGFIGPTAYSAIFSEHQGKLAMDFLDPCKSYRQNPATRVLSPPSHDIREYRIVYVYTPDEAGIRLGMNILNALPSQDLCERLLGHYSVFDDPVSHKPTPTFADKSLWDRDGTYLMEPRDPAKLSFVSEKLCRNAFWQSGDDTSKNRHTWLASFSGDHFDWEI